MSTAVKCAGCQNPLPKKDYLRCISCKSSYDIECANISHESFSRMEQKEKWKCPECLCKKPKTGNVNTPVRSSTSSVEEYKPAVIARRSEENQNITHRTKTIRPLQTISSIGSENADLTHNSSTLAELKLFMEELIQTQMGSIREAINELTNTLNAQNNRLEQLELRISYLENKAESIHDTSALASKISQLQADIYDRDQALLSNDLEISGCPETGNENCTHLILAVAKKVGVELEERDIVCAERAGPARPPASSGGASARPRPIAVRLTRRAPRDAMLKAARVRRDLNTDDMQLPGPVRPLYLNERLTKHNRLLFQRARDLGREMKYKFVWTRDGKVFVRQEPGMARHRLRLETDLLGVFGKVNI